MHTVLDLCTDATSKNTGITSRFLYAEPNDIMEIVEASTGIEPVYTDLQSAASPLRQLASRGWGRIRHRFAACKPPNGRNP